MKDSNDTALLAHCRTVSEVLPLIGFYLQPAVGGSVLAYAFWREFAEIENVAAIKIAPFNRYQTLDVVRAVAESGRDIALYTGNDDNIALDLLTPFIFQVNGRLQRRRIVGGLLGHWAVWTRRAVEFLDQCHAVPALAAPAHRPRHRSSPRRHALASRRRRGESPYALERRLSGASPFPASVATPTVSSSAQLTSGAADGEVRAA